MRAAIGLLLAVVACGSDPPPAKPKPGGGGGGGGGGGQAPGKVAPTAILVIKPTVDKAYRKEFAPSDFDPDPSGERNRDPFFSYLVAPATSRTQTQDECADRKVAEKFSYNDMKLIAIVVSGTKNIAMFKDPTGTGQTVAVGDCLSKDRARVVDITPGCVTIEIRGVPPPTAEAPPAPRPEQRCLDPNAIEIQ